jgi:hypothetical protein
MDSSTPQSSWSNFSRKSKKFHVSFLPPLCFQSRWRRTCQSTSVSNRHHDPTAEEVASSSCLACRDENRVETDRTE